MVKQSKQYRTRKEQIEKEFARELRRVLKAEGIGYLNAAQNRAIRKALRDAAMVGAAEERHRILQIESLNSRHQELIVEPSILKVLGYE